MELSLYKARKSYLHWFSGDNIVLEILEEKIFPDVMLRTVIFTNSED